MATMAVTESDYRFFDVLAPYVWPSLSANHIRDHKRPDVDNGLVQIESLLEVALANASGGMYKRNAINGMDFTDGGDAKKTTTVYRNNNKVRDQWMNSAPVRRITSKSGLLRVMCYSKIPDQFYYFAIPPKAYNGLTLIEIICDTGGGLMVPQGIPKGKWTHWQVADFDTLATITLAQANRL
jgi:hypothetical protein